MNMKFIRAQDGAVINLAHIISIDIMEGETTEKSKTVKAYAVVANDSQGKEHQLVISDTAEDCDEVMASIVSWISYSKEDVFDLTEDEAEDEKAEPIAETPVKVKKPSVAKVTPEPEPAFDEDDDAVY